MEEKKAKLKIELMNSWQDISDENPEGPATFVSSDREDAGVLQVSIQALYKSGEIPNPTHNELIRLSEGIALNQQAEIIKSYWGDCGFGKFGSVVSRLPEVGRMQIWTLSNGRDFVLATYFSSDSPPFGETAQAERMVKSIQLVRT